MEAAIELILEIKDLAQDDVGVVVAAAVAQDAGRDAQPALQRRSKGRGKSRFSLLAVSIMSWKSRG